MPLVSFVMPNKNRAEYLPESIGTILEQTLEDIELIVVDDESTDNSKDIIEEFRKKDKRVVPLYLKNQKDLYVAERIDRARNIGNQAAKSKYICVADSDDWYLPRRAQLTYEYLERKREYDLFYGAYCQRDKLGKRSLKLQYFMPAKSFSARQLKETGLFFIGHFTVGYRRETILKYPYNSDTGVGDWGMFYNLLIRRKVKSCFTEEPLCIYRVYKEALNQIDDLEFKKYLLAKKKKKMELLGELRNI